MSLMLGALYAGILLFFANQEVHTGRQNPLAQTMLAFQIFMLPLIGLNFFGTALVDPETFSRVPAGIYFVLSILVAGICYAILLYRETRLFIQRHIAQGAYNPDSLVHTTAIVLAFTLLMVIFITFLNVGGVQGVAADYEASDLSLMTIFFNQTIYVLVTLLGVGWLIRRDTPQVIQRLNLQPLTRRNILAGILGGIGLYGVLVVIGTFWIGLTSPEAFDAQTQAANQIFAAFSGSLLTAALLAMMTGIGEEILFRGGLQPIFGNVLTSLFFTLIHIQYTLTPATLIIFVVSLGFGWLRQRYSTTAAIIAHAVYNFIPFIFYFMGAT